MQREKVNLATLLPATKSIALTITSDLGICVVSFDSLLSFQVLSVLLMLLLRTGTATYWYCYRG